MNRKQLITLLLVGLVIGGIGYTTYQGRRNAFQTSDTQLGKKLIPDFPLNDVAHVRVVQAGGELNLVKQSDFWTVRERWNYPANYGEISELLRKVWELKPIQAVKVGPSQIGRLELNTPGTNQQNSGTLVEFKDKGSSTLKSLLLGKPYVRQSEQSSPMGGGDFPVGRYVMVPGGNSNVWLINDPLSNVETNPADWISKDFFKVEKLKSIAVNHAIETNSWRLFRETEGGELKLADTNANEQLDTGKASGAGFALSSPSFNDVAAPETKIETIGTNSPVSARLETFEGFVYQVKVVQSTNNENYLLSMNVEGTFPAERAPGSDEKPEDKERLDKEFSEKQKKLKEKLANEKKFTNWIYLVSKWTIDPVLKTRSDLLAVKKEENPAGDTGASVIPENTPPLIDPLKAE
ncbi:MAG: DUF4340 domain-containing protein [Verrucomicrobiota bacterium]|nr:DUF4340 domain-containing protein [Verrucomicrobiota bacterium]